MGMTLTSDLDLKTSLTVKPGLIETWDIQQ